MRHLILTLSLLLGLATSVSANDKPYEVGDVFYCQMESFLSWEWEKNKPTRYETEKFKFTIKDRKTLQFGQGGYLNGVTISINYMLGTLLDANKESAVLSLDDGKLTYVSSFYTEANMIAATCDRF